MFFDHLFRKEIKGKVRWFLPFYLFTFLPLSAQQSDPVVMTVNGVPVTRSEFCYSYFKNNGNGQADRKSVEEYAQLYANYKLKVAAALDARLDTTTAFMQELAMYTGRQGGGAVMVNTDLMTEARRLYDRSSCNCQHVPPTENSSVSPSVPTPSGELYRLVPTSPPWLVGSLRIGRQLPMAVRWGGCSRIKAL